VPATFAAFEQAITKAKGAGETPIQFGNLDKWPGIHEFEELWLQSVSIPYARNFVFGTGGGKTSFASAGTTAAASKLLTWAKQAPSRTATRASAMTRRGRRSARARRLPDHRQLADGRLKKAPRQERRLLPAAAAEGQGALDARRRGPAVGDQLEGEERRRGGDVPQLPHEQLVDAGRGEQRPAHGDEGAREGAVRHRHRGLQRVDAGEQADAIVPYLDWATPTMYDTITAAIQELMAGKTSPSSFVQKIQSDYSKFHKG
jgi:raffinose/stachyose/melibiose transport system substrate-binding protein